MNSTLIPKEQLSAYQRWEMGSLETAAGATAAEPEAMVDPLTMPTVEELERIREQARQEGYAAGLAEARQQGFEQGLEQGRDQARLEAATLCQIAAELSREMARADETIAQDVLALSLDVAKAILKTALSVQPQLILPAIREAIHYLPTLQPQAQLFLHPEDASIVMQYMGDDLGKAGWRIVGDEQMERGGCRVETGSNQIDVSMTTRWQRIAAVLGSQTDWLDQN